MGLIYESLARANERGLAGKCHGGHDPKTPAARAQHCHVVAGRNERFCSRTPLGERASILGGGQ